MLTLALASLLLTHSPVSADTGRVDTTAVAQVKRYDGTLAIWQISDGEVAREHQIRVNFALVLTDSVSQIVALHTLAGGPSGRRIALIEFISGGTACPAMYRVVEFGGDQRPTLSREFGDCSDIPVVVTDGTGLKARFPGFYHPSVAREPGFRRPPPVTWEYLGHGRVRRLPASRASR